MNDRTMIAAMFAAAAFSRSTEGEDWHHPDVLARVSIKFADALLKELGNAKPYDHGPYMMGYNHGVEEAAQLCDDSRISYRADLAKNIRALKKSEVK